MEKQPFFQAAMAGLGKYHMGSYGRIGVYRVNLSGPHLLYVIYGSILEGNANSNTHL